jgi:hypothetical protein
MANGTDFQDFRGWLFSIFPFPSGIGGIRWRLFSILRFRAASGGLRGIFDGFPRWLFSIFWNPVPPPPSGKENSCENRPVPPRRFGRKSSVDKIEVIRRRSGSVGPIVHRSFSSKEKGFHAEDAEDAEDAEE